MKNLNKAARIYITAVIVLGFVAVLYAWNLHADRWNSLHADRSSLVLLVIGCGLVLAAARIKIVLFKDKGTGRKNTHTMTMSLAFIPTLFLLVYLGPFAGALAGICNGASNSGKTPLHRHLFNAAMMTLTIGVAAAILRHFGLAPGEWKPLDSVQHRNTTELIMPLVGITLATLAYYAVNTGFVATAIALSTNKNPIVIWLHHLRWTGPGYFAGASCVTALLALYPYLTLSYSNIVAVVLVAVPVPTIIYYLYSYHTQLDDEKLARIGELNRNKDELEEINSELKHSKDELQQLYTATVESLALAIDAKDRYTKEHIQRVKGIAVSIAVEMGITGDQLKAVETGALLHDIGKIAVPEHILTKPGRLSDEEFEKIKTHPDMGARILEPVQFPFPVMPIVRHHHERWDGTGYPDGLAGETIPLGGRILAVADVYDALTSDRSYRAGWSHERAVEYLQEHSGSHFDPQVVVSFLVVVSQQPELFVPREAISFRDASRSGSPAAITTGINRASFEYSALYDISQALWTTLNLSDTLTLIAERIQKLFDASTCVLLLERSDDASDESLRVERAIGVGQHKFHGAHAATGSRMTAMVAASGQGVVRTFDPGDIKTQGGPIANFDAGDESFQSVMISPLIANSFILGTVNLYHTRASAFDGEDLRVLQAIGVQAGRAIQKAIEFERTLDSALRDAITGLYNARHLNQFLEHELHVAVVEPKVLSVLVLDLDNFKPVNDTYGHAHGNMVLRDVGQIFQNVLKEGDLVARYAGDEFVVVLPGTDAFGCRAVIETIRAAVHDYDARPLGVDDVERIRIEVSVGAATFPHAGKSSVDLITVADRAMFHDKKYRKSLTMSEEGSVQGLRLVA